MIAINPDDSDKTLQNTFTNLTILLTLFTALNDPFRQPTFRRAEVLKERLDHANYSARGDNVKVMEAATQILVVNQEILALMSCGGSLKNQCVVSAKPVNQGKDKLPQACSISDCWQALKLWAAPNPGDTGHTGLQLLPDEYAIFTLGKGNDGNTSEAGLSLLDGSDCHAQSLWDKDHLHKFNIDKLLEKQRVLPAGKGKRISP